MRISRSRQFKVNMGNYESYEFGCVVTIDHSDLGYTDEEAREKDLTALVAELTDRCMGVLNDQLVDEIKEAQQLTASEKSFLIDSFASEQQKPRTRKVGR